MKRQSEASVVHSQSKPADGRAWEKSKATQDCKRFASRLLVPLCLLGCFHTLVYLGLPLQAQPPGEVTEKDKAEAVPKLTLESLFHPQQRFDFDGSLPTTHWVSGESPALLVKRNQSWNELDLQTGQESAWPIVDQLLNQLSQLQGVSMEQTRKAAISAVPQLSDVDESILVRIDKALALVSADRPARWLTQDATSWGNATLDPTGRRVAYTRDGDLFLVDCESDRSLQLTNDGTDTVLDGVLDWTYQEEIFGRGNFRGFWFSPNGQWLAMLRIDISEIQPYTLSEATSQRGKGVVSRYPKAGDPIPHAELHLWDLRDIDGGDVPPSRLLVKSTADQERIVTGAWWHPHQARLIFSVSDRLQTWREVRAVDEDALPSNEHTQLLFREESPAWVEPPAEPGWIDDGSMVWKSEIPSGRTRLYHVSVDGKVKTPISPDNFDVRDFLVSKDRAFAIVTGDVQRGTIERHAYRIDLRSPSPELVPLTEAAGWHSTKISPDGAWFVDQFSKPTSPPNLVVRSTSTDETLPIASSSLKLSETISDPELFDIKTPDGVALPAMLYRPRNATATEPCGVVVEVYGGPQAPVVSSRWQGAKSLYRELLARRGIATLLVDNRSSSGRLADTWSIRHRVGEVEMADLEVAIEWLQAQEWVDSKRLAIRGWSFGGFLTLFAMTHSDAFVAGIAGGSVTDWKEYDAFYTERYMGLPTQNAEGYETTAPVLMADKLQGMVLLIHGESDDNVHPSNTMRMASALQNAGKDFRLMIYPGSAHAVRDPKQAWHMVQMTDRFLMEHLGGEE